MVTIYNTTLSATSQRHFSDSLGGGNKRLLSKRKIRWYTIAMKVLLFSSFEKQKEYIWHFSETRIKR